MGGRIAIIKKEDDKVEGIYSWTNSFSRVTIDPEFWKDPKNSKELKEHLKPQTLT